MSQSDLIGRRINGRYELTRLIGEGGMGAVFEGEHVEVGRKVAVKVVSAAFAGNAEVVARLKQEARACGAVESENIVQVLDAGEDPVAGLFVVMELLRGENLESLLEREKRLPPAAAAMIAIQAARGLSRAHAQGIIHRDLKPANIVLCEREDKTPLVKLVDFGIAKLVRDANEPSCKLTRTGGVVGTPQYMAPEQAQGLDSVDARSDVYSLGTVLYEMLVGAPAVPELANYEQMLIHLVTQPAKTVRETAPDIDERLDALVAEMMAKNQADRPPDMETVIARLSELFTHEEIVPRSFDGIGLRPQIARPSHPPRLRAPTESAVVVKPITHAAASSNRRWLGGGLIAALLLLFTFVKASGSTPERSEAANVEPPPPAAEPLPTVEPAPPPLPPAASAPVASTTRPPAPRPRAPAFAPPKPHVFGAAGLSNEF